MKAGSSIKIGVREVKMDDLQDLFPIYNSEKRKHPLNKYPLTEWILGSSVLFLLAETQKSKLGFIVVRKKGEEASIDLLCVKRGFKKEQIEKELIKSAAHALSDRVITLVVPKKNRQKILRYKKEGLKVIEEFKAEKPGNSFVVMSIKSSSKPVFKKIIKPVKKPAKKKKILKQNLEKLKKHEDYIDYFGKDMLS